jgi:hypothetical protein
MFHRAARGLHEGRPGMAQVMLCLASALLFIHAAHAGEAAGGKLSIRAERVHDGTVEQQAVVFGKSELTVTRNANFLCTPGFHAELGSFRRPYDKIWRERREEVQQIANRSEPGSDAPAPQAQAGVRVFVGHGEITAREAFAATVTRMIAATCEDPALKPDNAVTVTIDRSGTVGAMVVKTLGKTSPGEDVRISMSAAHCEELGPRDPGVEYWSCEVPRHGRASLKVKPTPPRRP